MKKNFWMVLCCGILGHGTPKAGATLPDNKKTTLCAQELQQDHEIQDLSHSMLMEKVEQLQLTIAPCLGKSLEKFEPYQDLKKMLMDTKVPGEELYKNLRGVLEIMDRAENVCFHPRKSKEFTKKLCKDILEHCHDAKKSPIDSREYALALPLESQSWQQKVGSYHQHDHEEEGQ